jgi:hypothetical protein
MSTTVSAPTDLRKLLFVSYAYGDEVFAKWLARKLAFYGYGVWIDQIEILGGESWVKEVDVAIKERSFRVLGLLSKASVKKDNPLKERTLALQLGKQLDIKDFLITLSLDGVQPEWTVSDISWISFRESWAEGLRRLLKKLAALDAPRIHEGNSAIAKAALDRGEALLTNKKEDLVTNWMFFENLSELLRVYDTSSLAKKDEELWPNYRLERGRVVALSAPPRQLVDGVKETRETYHWPSCDQVHNTATHNIIVLILKRAINAQLLDAGCSFLEGSKTYYLPDPFREESIFRFKDADDSKTYIRTSGKIRIRKPAGPPETVIYHPSLRFSVRGTDAGSYVLQLQPGVALFDAKHQPITNEKAGPRRKKVTRSWYNAKWRKRLLAFSQILIEAAEKDANAAFSIGGLFRLSTDRALDEQQLAVSEETAQGEVADEEVEITLDEMEEWVE